MCNPHIKHKKHTINGKIGQSLYDHWNRPFAFKPLADDIDTHVSHCLGWALLQVEYTSVCLQAL